MKQTIMWLAFAGLLLMGAFTAYQKDFQVATFFMATAAAIRPDFISSEPEEEEAAAE